MDGRHAQLVREPIERLPKVTRRPASSVDQPARRLSRGWAAVLGIGWPLAIAISVAVEPAPAEPDALPVLVEWAGVISLFVLFVTVVAAMARSWAAVPAGVVTGVFAVAFSATCPLTSHHGLGLWWVAQFAVVTGMLGVTLGGLRTSTTNLP